MAARNDTQELQMKSSEITAIAIPKWGVTMTEGRIVGWLKQPGQSFAEVEELLEKAGDVNRVISRFLQTLKDP
jgi:hypothetical protein